MVVDVHDVLVWHGVHLVSIFLQGGVLPSVRPSNLLHALSLTDFVGVLIPDHLRFSVCLPFTSLRTATVLVRTVLKHLEHI